MRWCFYPHPDIHAYTRQMAYDTWLRKSDPKARALLSSRCDLHPHPKSGTLTENSNVYRNHCSSLSQLAKSKPSLEIYTLLLMLVLTLKSVDLWAVVLCIQPTTCLYDLILEYKVCRVCSKHIDDECDTQVLHPCEFKHL